MNHRAKIPGLALLTLSLTDCVDRSPGADGDVDPIVGDWHATMVDGYAFPMIESEGPDQTYTLNIELSVHIDLQGTLVLAIDSEYDGYVGGYEQGSTLVVDASAAPKYRIDVKHDPFGGPGSEEGYYDPTGYGSSGGYGSSAGYDTDPTTGYDTDPTTGGDTGGTTGASTGGVLDEPGSSLPLAIPVTPHRAPADMILRCTLSADVLDCKRDGDLEPTVWVFKRTPDDGA